jgi:hypothetical protein
MASSQNSLSNFKSSFKGGTRANRFYVDCNFPAAAIVGQVLSKAYFNISSASIPKSDVGVIGVPFRGRMAYYAGDRQYSVWPIRVYDDGDTANDLWRTFQKWKEMLDGHNTHTVYNSDYSYKSLKQTWWVTQTGLNAGAIRQIKLIDCWPSEIGGINFDLGSSDFVSFDVTLTFDKFNITQGI